MLYRIKSVFVPFVFFVYLLVCFPVKHEYIAVFSRSSQQVYGSGYRARQVGIEYDFLDTEYVEASPELLGDLPPVLEDEFFLFVFRLSSTCSAKQNIFTDAVYLGSKHAARVPVRVPFGLQRLRRLSELCRLAPEYLAGRVEFRKELVDERGTRSILHFFSVNN